MNQKQCLFEVMSTEDRKKFLSSDFCYINKFIGNEEAVKRLSRAVFVAFGNEHHNCSEYSFAIYGPPSTGKTYLAKLFAKTLCIPFVVIEPQTIKKTHDIFVEIDEICKEFSAGAVASGDIELVDIGNNDYVLPSMIVFIDEVHNLKSNVVQGLLKATEPTDRIMMTEMGYKICTKNVCWIIATTDRGDLFDAFDTRFQKVSLRLYSKKEMAKIIKMSNPDWSDSVCELVAKYNSFVPREAIAFSKDMRVEHEINPDSWENIACTVAEDHGIDSSGMTYTRLSVLKALGQNPMSASQLPFVAHVKEDELKKYIMPPLLARTPDQKQPLVSVSSRGYTITPAGLEQLDKRKIPNRGLFAIPESVRDSFVLI
jgi:Holliday junction resolvasome RuvABC ATP-dependent DNA helicase subunit